MVVRLTGSGPGNLIGLAAARATLTVLSEPDFYPTLAKRTTDFLIELQAIFDRSPWPARVQWLGCMFEIYIGTREPVRSYADIRALDPDLSRHFFTRLHRRGRVLPQRLLGFRGALARPPRRGTGADGARRHESRLSPGPGCLVGIEIGATAAKCVAIDPATG
jgi:hypothetical protein